MGQVLPLVVHEVGNDGVVDGVGFDGLTLRCILLVVYFRGVDLEFLHTLFQLRIVVVGPGHSDHIFIEVGSELLDVLEGVSVRVH